MLYEPYELMCYCIVFRGVSPDHFNRPADLPPAVWINMVISKSLVHQSRTLNPSMFIEPLLAVFAPFSTNWGMRVLMCIQGQPGLLRNCDVQRLDDSKDHMSMNAWGCPDWSVRSPNWSLGARTILQQDRELGALRVPADGPKR